MPQQYIYQEIEQIARQHELGILQREYNNGKIGGQITCLILSALVAAPFLFVFIIFLMIYFKSTNLWYIPFVIIALIAGFLLFRFISKIRDIYRNRYSQKLLYSNGLMVVKAQNEQIVAAEAIRWSDIAIVWYEIKILKGSGPEDSSMHIEYYRVQRANGEIFGKAVYEHVDNLLKDLVGSLTLGKYIEQMVEPYLWPDIISTYEQRQAVNFGPLTVHTSGIEYEHDIIPWDYIEKIKRDQEEGRLLIIPRKGSPFSGSNRIGDLISSAQHSGFANLLPVKPWAIVYYEQIPNLALLLKLIQSIREETLQA